MRRRELFRASVAGGLASVFSTVMSNSAPASDSTTASSETDATSIRASSLERTAIPVIHQTDLFHPHGDPDDHFDLATVYALHDRQHIDLQAMILDFDYPLQYRTGDPDVMAVGQMNRLCGESIPAAVGSSQPFNGDPHVELPKCETAAIRRILSTLRNATQPVAISCVGSANDIAWAAAYEPELFREKCAGVYLNAGAAQDDPQRSELLEFNVQLNPAAYAAMFQLPCPLYWFPCWNQVEQREPGEFGTFYWMPHADVLDGCSKEIQNFFMYMFTQSNDPHWLLTLDAELDTDRWTAILRERRGMWSTASLLWMAGLTVLQDGNIIPISEAHEHRDLLFRMDPISVSCGTDGRTQWKLNSNANATRWIFHNLAPERYATAMTLAVRHLLQTWN